MPESLIRSTAKSHMVDPIDDIVQQARQGSVAAIIQVLNEKLAAVGVRTRAVYANNVLQLLCEAAHRDQLEQGFLVDRVRQILESISPRNIRRVNINSRIVREQQLLWLEEITRDPDNLLWSEEIILRRPNIFKRLFAPTATPSKSRANKPPLPSKPPSQLNREQRLMRRGLVRGVTLSAVLLVVGAGAYYYWTNRDRNTPDPAAPGTETVIPSAPTTTSLPTVAETDPFAEAVRLAEQAAAAGQDAQTPAQWLDLAAQWQKASDLMASVPSDDSRYAIAQDRTAAYRQNSLRALQEAEKRRS